MYHRHAVSSNFSDSLPLLLFLSLFWPPSVLILH